MSITVNGQSYLPPLPETIAALIARLGLDVQQIAVEMDGVIIPRSHHAHTPIVAGAVLEIVDFVGGG